MGAKCNKCGMVSDRDDICTWCNADIKQPRPAAGAQPAQRQPAAAAEAEAHEAPGRPAWLMPVGAAAGLLVLVVVALLIIGAAASGPPPEPGEWRSFTARDNSFAAHYPEGWGEPANSGSAGSFVLVEWKAGKLGRVRVQGTSKAGSIGDVSAATERNLAAEAGPDGLPVGKSADGAVLAWSRDHTDFVKRRPRYQEGEPVFAYDFANVRSAMVEYEYSRRVGLLRVEMRGVRWGSHQGDYGYHAYAEAPKKHWESFWPVAEQIVGSVQFGRGA